MENEKAFDGFSNAPPKIMRKLRGAFYGFDFTECPINDRNVYRVLEIQERNMHIKLALQCIIGKRLWPRLDKSEWDICFSFKEHAWFIWDWKTQTCLIESTCIDEITIKEISRKILASVKIVDRLIYEISKRKLIDEDFILKNSYLNYSNLTSSFMEKAKFLFADSEILDESHAKHFIVKARNFVYFKSLDNYSEFLGYLLGCVGMYFSMLEAVFDACFCVDAERTITYAEFRRLKWAERASTYLVLESNKEKELLSSIQKVYRDVRNRTFHFDPTYLYHVPSIGYFPASLDDVSGIGMEVVPFDADQAHRIIKFLEDFQQLVSTNRGTRRGYLLASSGMPFDANKERQRSAGLLTEHLFEFEPKLASIVDVHYRIINGEF